MNQDRRVTPNNAMSYQAHPRPPCHTSTDQDRPGLVVPIRDRLHVPFRNTPSLDNPRPPRQAKLRLALSRLSATARPDRDSRNPAIPSLDRLATSNLSMLQRVTP